MKLILASASPRRKEILERMGIPFEVRVSEADEKITEPLPPAAYVETLACRKAQAIKLLPGEVILGADTVVALDGKILGKPQSREEAVAMLAALSGRNHAVYTGVCLTSLEQTVCFSEMTEVCFYPLLPEEIEAYVDTGEPMDKAGAYGIQERGGLFVSGIRGDFFNVMGLPVSRIVQCLQGFRTKI